MSRLINADKLIEELEELKQEKTIGTCKVMIKESIDIVKAQPTIQPQGIDKDRLIEFIDDIKHNTMYEDEFDEYSPYEIIAIMDELIDFIDQQPTSDGWIPTSSGERPKDGQKVLCSCRNNILDVLKWNENNRLWIAQYPRHEYFDSFVLAWQPLPPAYKESE